jgi:threonine/homoserine/homoserine lactone efflux protein
MGFITNVTNPKVTLFFLALFTQIIDPVTPLGIQLLYGVEMMIATTAWFTLVAILFSHHFVKKQFEKVGHIAEKTMGIILIGLGIKLALSSAK